MKLILFLCLYIFTFETVTVINKGELEYGISKKITSNGNCIFVDYDRYKGSTIRANVTVKNGRFAENRMWWGGYNSYPGNGGEYILKVNELYSSYESGQKIGDNYETFTYIFKISKSSYFNYAFLAIPYFYGDYVLIECTSGGLSLTAIAFIVIGCIALMILLISIIIYIRKKRARYNPPTAPVTQPTYISPTQQVYSPPVQQMTYGPSDQQIYKPPTQQPYDPSIQKPYADPSEQNYAAPIQQGYAPPVQPIDVPPAQPTYMPDYPSG